MRITLFLAILSIIILLGCTKGDDPQATLILEEANKASMEGDYQLATELLTEIMNKYPNTTASKIAAEQFDTFNNFAKSSKEPRINDLMEKIKHVARAVELYKHKKNKFPSSLDDLIPKYLPSKAYDSYDNLILFKKTSKGYIIASFGKDGIPGGSGNNKDLFLQDGNIVPSIEF